jgi:hexosaminidase
MRMMIRYGCVAMLGAVLCGCQTKPPARPASSPLIPAPAIYEPTDGHFEVRDATPIVVRGNDAEAAAVAHYLAEVMQRSRGLHLDVKRSTDPKPGRAIELALDPAFFVAADDHGEGYDLRVAADGISLQAKTAHGLFNGAVSLWQLMTADSPAVSAVTVPTGHIVDYPRFAWRGLLLDSARHFQSTAFVKRFIDAMALHKLNVMHWHLTDDQGWRIEIRKYPKLTEVGAWRDPQPNELALVDQATGKYGGFYTQEQIREIVRYAAERFVTIVPEIDMPGHAQAAIAAYPKIGVTGRQPPVSSDWGINTYIYNVDESTFAFIGDVLAEVTELFPSPYIHVGGDEAAKDQWQASTAVQERMHRLGIRDEQALQGYFTARLEALLRARGRRLVGWDEILESGLPPGAVVMSWRGSAGAIAAVGHGNDVIMAPDPVTYLDHLQGNGPDEPPGRVKVLSLADVYAFDPLPRELSAEQATHVLGAQVNLWSEYFTTGERLEYAAFPRAAAIAERLWSPAERTGWNDFVARLPAQLERYRALGIHYSDSAFAPQGEISATADAGRFEVTLTKQVEFGTIHYTLDGRVPGSHAPVYREPFVAKAPVTLRAAAFAGNRQLSAVREMRIDASSAARRGSDRLKTCGDSLLLRLEGATTAGAPTPLYNVDLMNSCWIYPQIDLAATARIEVRTGALPYFFQLWHDADKVVMHTPSGDADELQLHLDTCDGPLLAATALPADRLDVRTLTFPLAAATAESRGKHDVCLYFAARSRDPLRLIDWVEPIPRHK